MAHPGKRLKWVGILLSIVALIAMRWVGKLYFNDPLIPFFELADYSNAPFPKIDWSSYFFQLEIRYLINSTLSIAILLLLFQRKGLLAFLTVIFLSVGLLSSILLGYQLLHQDNYTLLLFARRIMMHPIVLLTLVPALFFQLRQEKI